MYVPYEVNIQIYKGKIVLSPWMKQQREFRASSHRGNLFIRRVQLNATRVVAAEVERRINYVHHRHRLHQKRRYKYHGDGVPPLLAACRK